MAERQESKCWCGVNEAQINQEFLRYLQGVPIFSKMIVEEEHQGATRNYIGFEQFHENGTCFFKKNMDNLFHEFVDDLSETLHEGDAVRVSKIHMERVHEDGNLFWEFHMNYTLQK